jgi:hypothetical protein
MQPHGVLRRTLGWHHSRKDPLLRSQRWPFYVRHPAVWLFGRALPKAAWRLIRLLTYRARHHRWLTPYVVALWLWLAALVFGAIPSGWRTLLVLAVVGGVVTWRQIGLPLPALGKTTGHGRQRQIAVGAVYVATAGLIMATAVYRPLVWIPGPLLLWATVAPWLVGWWRLPEAGTTVTAPDVDARIAHWEQRIGGEGKRLAGAQLCDVVPIRLGGQAS